MKATTAVPAVTTPYRAPAVTPDLRVPLLQAAVEGLWALVALIVSLLISAQIDRWAAWWLYAGGAAILFLVFMLRAWPRHLEEARSALWTWEAKHGEDVDGDGIVGRPHHPLYIRSGPVHATPGTEGEQTRLAQFVADCLRYGTTLDALKPYGWDRDVVGALGGYLRDTGAATWSNASNHNLGWTLDAKRAQEVLARTVWLPD